MSFWTDFRDIGTGETARNATSNFSQTYEDAKNALTFHGDPGQFGNVQRYSDMPGSPTALMHAVSADDWSNPYGRENSWDRFAGGGSSGNPFIRGAGRTVGTVAAGLTGAGYFGGGEAAPAASLTAEGEGGNAAYYGGSDVGGGGALGTASLDPEMAGVTGYAAPSGGWSFGMPSLGQFGAGLGITSSMYGLYLSDQARRERNRQLQRQREYQNQLNALISNPGSVTSLPGYSFRMGQGEQAVARRMAASGFGGRSGNLGVALTKYGQDYATGELERQEGLLAQLYGLSGPSTNVRDPYEMAGRSLGSLGYGVGRLNG